MWPFATPPDVTFRKALSCMNRGDHSTAVGLFRKVSKQPGTLQADAVFNVAVCLVKTGDFGGGHRRALGEHRNRDRVLVDIEAKIDDTARHGLVSA